MQALAHKWISVLSQYFWHQREDKRNTGNQGKVTQKEVIAYISADTSLFQTVILYVGFGLFCPFLPLMPKYTQSHIFLFIFLRLTNLYLLAISPQFLIKCCSCKTVNTQTLKIILQPRKYSSRLNPEVCRCYFRLLSLEFQI